MPNINVNLPAAEVTLPDPVTVTPASGAVFNVNVENGPSPSTVNTPLVYNEVTSVTSGVETSISTYTVPTGVSSYLIQIECAGNNNGIYIVYRNGSVIDKKYTTYGAPLDIKFDFEVGYSSVPGLELATGDVILVTVTQASTSMGTFNAKIQALEVVT